MHPRRPLVSAPEGLWSELAWEPGRLGASVRITVTALLVAVVMLTFRMPFLSIGPYLVFILAQRDTLLTRAAAVLAILIGLLSCGLVHLLARVAWDTAWLRVSLLIAIFYGGYYLMRILSEPRIILGALVVIALFAPNFDTVPYPNELLSQLGWIWAIFGLLFVTTFLTQWLLRAPTALELLRVQMRRILVAAEAACLENAQNRQPAENALARDREEAAMRIHLLAETKNLTPAQAASCQDVLSGCNALLIAAADNSPSDPEESSRLRTAAAWLRRWRFRILVGPEIPLEAPTVLPRNSALHGAFEEIAASALGSPVTAPSREKAGPLPADWASNPLYASFATRATLATMTCYVFMTLADWDDIHTCMITCVVTALALTEERFRKQNLRIGGALIGGLLGIGAVVTVIPRFDSLIGLLLILAGGSMLAAWVTLGGKHVSYAGWQIALAFYMTVLQDPHPTTKLDPIWDRLVGIALGILAMRAAFALPDLRDFLPRQAQGGEIPPQDAPVA